VLDALRIGAVAAILCGIAACANYGPAYPDFAASAPSIAPGNARLVVYRNMFTPPQAFTAMITVDGRAAGALPMGTWLFVDEPAGVRQVDSPLWPAYSAFGGQLRTTPIEVALAPGTTSFVSVELLSAGPIQVTLVPMDAADALRDLARLEMAPPPESLP